MTSKTLVKDLVCGMVKPIAEMKAHADFQGRRYYFCWEGDKEMFLNNPDRWVPHRRGSLTDPKTGR